MSVSATHRLLRRADYLAMPWRNGAGTTLEILRASGSDAGARGADVRSSGVDAPFDWRLSLASIAQSGEFSRYPGYQRSVTLIEGQGFRLHVADQPRAELAAVGATALFPGAADTSCTLLGGPCTDLSLMVRAPGEILAVTPLSVQGRRELALGRGADRGILNALFCVTGSALIAADELQRHDTLLVAPGLPGVTVQTDSHTPALLVLLTWR